MWNAIWDDRPAEYAAKRDCWLTRRRSLYVSEFLDEASPGQRVLEIGSGVGELLIALAAGHPGLHFTGVEPQQSYVTFAAEAAARAGLSNLCFKTSPAEEIPSLFASAAPFDWILSNDMLHHVSDQEEILRALARVASPAARWLAIEPNWRNPYVLIACAVKSGEQNFWPGRFLDRGRRLGWACRQRSFLFLIPPVIKNPPRLLIGLERVLERNSLVAGGVALTLVRS